MSVRFLFRVERPDQQSFYKVSTVQVVSTQVSETRFFGGISQVKGASVPRESCCISCSLKTGTLPHGNMGCG